MRRALLWNPSGLNHESNITTRLVHNTQNAYPFVLPAALTHAIKTRNPDSTCQARLRFTPWGPNQNDKKDNTNLSATMECEKRSLRRGLVVYSRPTSIKSFHTWRKKKDTERNNEMEQSGRPGVCFQRGYFRPQAALQRHGTR